MKAEERTLYYTEDYISGKLIDNLQLTSEAKQINLSEDSAINLINVLHDNISPAAHRCISVYRDAFVFRGHTYNICLSCGDFYRDDKHWYLTQEGIEQFKEIKNSL